MHKKHVKHNERSSAENSAIKMRSINKAEEFLLFLNGWSARRVLSRQAYFCRDKRRVLTRQTQNLCRDKNHTCGISRQCVLKVNCIFFSFFGVVFNVLLLFRGEFGVCLFCVCVCVCVCGLHAAMSTGLRCPQFAMYARDRESFK